MTTGEELAIQGGNPVHQMMLPYGRQWLEEENIAAVVEVLRSDWITTGPKVAEFEQAFAEAVGAREAVAVSNGIAALHVAIYIAKVSPGDEVIVSPMISSPTHLMVCRRESTIFGLPFLPEYLGMETTACISVSPPTLEMHQKIILILYVHSAWMISDHGGGIVAQAF